ncbi:hypothetical protein E2C01_054658 [Portunus trituberculatus]|uniref:Uncharacterized protein n=1 Tax=Portunus trituberculatus TaxID=210409 RepID=A0A5B7GT95_PORTR|nr:hypothetical protein [Portunus trituberculatus]
MHVLEHAHVYTFISHNIFSQEENQSLPVGQNTAASRTTADRYSAPLALQLCPSKKVSSVVPRQPFITMSNSQAGRRGAAPLCRLLSHFAPVPSLLNPVPTCACVLPLDICRPKSSSFTSIAAGWPSPRRFCHLNYKEVPSNESTISYRAELQRMSIVTSLMCINLVVVLAAVMLSQRTTQRKLNVTRKFTLTKGSIFPSSNVNPPLVLGEERVAFTKD